MQPSIVRRVCSGALLSLSLIPTFTNALVVRSDSDARSTPTRGPGVNRYSDEDLFRGLLLGSGPVASLIPEIRDNLRPESLVADQRQLALIREVHARIVSAVRQKDPTFFHAFAAEVRSGDRIRIDRAYQKASALTLESVNELPQVRQLRAHLARDPRARQELRDQLLRAAPADAASAADRAQRADAALAMLGGENASGRLNGTCVELIYLVSIAVTVAAVVNYLVAAQVAIALEAVINMTIAQPGSVMHELMIDSAARLLRA